MAWLVTGVGYALAVVAPCAAKHLVSSVFADIEKWLLSHSRGFGHEGDIAAVGPIVSVSRLISIVAKRDSYKTEIVGSLTKYAAAMLQVCVAREPLLLPVGAFKVAVGGEAAADPALLPLVLDGARGVYAAYGSRLRHSPLEHLIFLIVAAPSTDRFSHERQKVHVPLSLRKCGGVWILSSNTS